MANPFMKASYQALLNISECCNFKSYFLGLIFGTLETQNMLHASFSTDGILINPSVPTTVHPEHFSWNNKKRWDKQKRYIQERPLCQGQEILLSKRSQESFTFSSLLIVIMEIMKPSPHNSSPSASSPHTTVCQPLPSYCKDVRWMQLSYCFTLLYVVFSFFVLWSILWFLSVKSAT